MFHVRHSRCQTACKENSTFLGWGGQSSGQLGVNNRATYISPIAVPGDWISFSAGNGASSHSGRVKTDNTLWLVGRNVAGQLGQITNRTDRSSPVQVAGTTWCQVAAGFNMTYALKTNNTLWSWGCNLQGQLGLNCSTTKSSPVQVPGTTWCKVIAGCQSGYAFRTDNTLWRWGLNTTGILGDSTTANKSSPIQLTGDWKDISIRNTHVLGLKCDNTLWAWGSNDLGQLGQNNIVCYSSPIQITGTDWCAIGAGLRVSAALKTDNTLWVWGNNASGFIGQNDDSTLHRSSPVQVPGTWCKISVGDEYILAQRTDNTLWGWGIHSSDQLGINDTTFNSYSSPVQVCGTGWTEFYASSASSFGVQKSITCNGNWSNLSGFYTNTPQPFAAVTATESNNDDVFLSNFKFCMGDRSKIIRAELWTCLSISGTTVYGAGTTGWSGVKIKNANTIIESWSDFSSSSSFSNMWKCYLMDENLLTPQIVTNPNFHVQLSNRTPSGTANVVIHSNDVTLHVENSPLQVSQIQSNNPWFNIDSIKTTQL